METLVRPRNIFAACGYAEMRSRLLPLCFPDIMPEGGEADLDDVSD
jgi:hypothetical protein